MSSTYSFLTSTTVPTALRTLSSGDFVGSGSRVSEFGVRVMDGELHVAFSVREEEEIKEDVQDDAEAVTEAEAEAAEAEVV